MITYDICTYIQKLSADVCTIQTLSTTYLFLSPEKKSAKGSRRFNFKFYELRRGTERPVRKRNVVLGSKVLTKACGCTPNDWPNWSTRSTHSQITKSARDLIVKAQVLLQDWPVGHKNKSIVYNVAVFSCSLYLWPKPPTSTVAPEKPPVASL